MKKISSFRLNRDKNILLLLRDLKAFIKKILNEKEIQKFISNLSASLMIPKKILHLEFEQIIYKNFENQNGKFSKKFYLRNVIFSSTKFLLICFFIIFNSKKIEKKTRTKLIVDDIDKNNIPDRFFSLSKKIDTIFISTHQLDKKFKTFIFKKYLNCSKLISFISNPKKVFQIFLFTLIHSFKSKNNLFPFAIEVIKCVAKYETVFSRIKADFTIQERHYNTSALKNFIFKQKGGKLNTVVQKNIFQINGIGMYINTDIFFSLGNLTAKDLSKLGGRAKMIIPIGSLFMEYNFHFRKEKNSNKVYDILVFASDHNKIFHSGYNEYYKEYLVHFDWIKKFAIKFPKYHIGIKLKKVITDQVVVQKFKDIQNVNFLFDRGSYSDSYYLGQKAKALCTWSSTLAFEFLGDGRVSYFIDPQNKNISFIPNEKHLLKFKLNSYKKFENNLLIQIQKPSKRILRNKKESNNFCLKSDKVSINIYKNLKKLI